MTEQAIKNEKKWSIIGKVFAVLFVLLAGKAVVGDGLSVMIGDAAFPLIIRDIAGVTLLACGLLFLFFTVWLPIVQIKKSVRAEEYLKLIHAGSSQELMQALDRMNCSVVKKVYMDENGNVCGQGNCTQLKLTVRHRRSWNRHFYWQPYLKAMVRKMKPVAWNRMRTGRKRMTRQTCHPGMRQKKRNQSQNRRSRKKWNQDMQPI